MLGEFKKFILRGNVVDLAVGVVIGAAFNSLVQSFVTNVINPIVGIFWGGQRFAERHIEIHGSSITYGNFLNSLVSFVLVGAAVFFLVVKPINALNEMSMRNKDTEEPTTKKCRFCFSEIPKQATRCKFCTSQLEAKKA